VKKEMITLPLTVYWQLMMLALSAMSLNAVMAKHIDSPDATANTL